MKLALASEHTLDELRVAQEIVSLEAFAGTDGLKQALARLPKIYESSKVFYAKFLGNMAVGQFRSKDLRDLSFGVERFSYADIRGIDVLVPEGLNVDLLSYAQTLHAAGQSAALLEVDVLKPFENWLGTMLGRPAELATLTQNLKIPEMRLHNTAEAEKRIQTCFVHTGRREAIVLFGKAFRRNADVMALAVELEKLDVLFGKDTQRRIVESIERISSMTAELILNIEQNPKDYAASPAAVSAMAQICYQVARELEHYGLMRYRLTELSNSIDETRKKIGTWLNYQKLK